MIDVDKVISVYRGRPGCMCGCRGKHRYASKFRAVAGKQRGYDVTDDEVSDRSVKLVVAKLERDPSTKIEDGIAYVDTGTRRYVAYLE